MVNNNMSNVNNKTHSLEQAENAVSILLQHIGENPVREGLKDTPRRVAKAWREMARGYGESPSQILQTTFAQNDEDVTPYRGLIVLRGIEFVSVCEHHCLPFTGEAHVVYVPNESGRIVGISKLARLVDCFARRLQVQERLTVQITDALEAHLQPVGVMVVIEAQHSCMRLRGVGKQGSTMLTSEARGVLEVDAALRADAWKLIQNKN